MTPTKNSKASDHQKQSKLLLCEYELEIKYPLSIMNCLPISLKYKLTKPNESLIAESDNLSRISLSRFGDELYSKCFNKDTTEQIEGTLNRVTKEKILGVFPESYPLLTIESETSKSRSFIKLQKYIAKVVVDHIGRQVQQVY